MKPKSSRKHLRNRRNAVSVPPTPGLALASDTGLSTTDRITRIGTVRVLGLLSGATWQYSLNGGATWLSGSSTSFVVPRGSYATGQVQVRQRSSAGVFSAANTGFAAFTVDNTAAPPRMLLAADTGRFSTDRVTNNGTIQLEGLEQGATWQYSLNGGSTWLNGSGSSFVVPRGSYSTGRVRVRQRDLAGNLSAANTSFAAFTVDNLVAPLRLALAADTGSSSTDRITRNASLLVSGLESGATWQFSLDGGETWQDGTGSSVVVPDGSYGAGQVQVRQIDRAGNISTANAPLAAFTIDTAVAAPELALGDDTGSSGSDRITSTRAILVSGVEEGATWQYSINGGATWITDSGSGFLLADGTYSAGQVRVRQIDRAGNTSAANTTFAAFTIDTAVAAPGLALAADTGSSASDRVTSTRTLIVSGLEAGASWEYTLDGGSNWTSGSGSSFDLADGSYGAGQVQVRQTDRAGNTSAATTTFAAFTIDTAAAAPGLALAADTGSSAGDRLTNNRTIQVLGLEAGATWQVSLNGGISWSQGSGSSFDLADGSYGVVQVQVRQTDRAGNTSAANASFAALTIDTAVAAPGLALAADTGSSAIDRITGNRTITVSGLEEGASWQYSLNGGSSWSQGSGSSFELADGSYGAGQVQVRQTDRAGNTSAANASFAALTIDTLAAAPTLKLAADTGSSSSDRITANRTIQVSGLEAGASWEFSLNGGSSWTSGSGTSFELADGSYARGQVQVRQTDLAGNTSSVNTTFAAFAIDTMAATPGLALAADTGSSSSDRLTNNGTILVSGLEADASWEFSLNGGGSWTNGSGSSFDLADGTYSAGQVRVRQTDQAGNTSAANTSFAAFTIDTAVAVPGLALAADTGSSSSDRITSNPTIQVSGLEAGASWEFSRDGGSSWQAGSGSSFTLADGSYGAGQVRVRQTDLAGNTSSASTAFAAFTIDTAVAIPGLALAADTGSSSSDRITSNPTIQVSGLEAAASWEFSIDGGSSWQAGSGSGFALADGSYGAGQVRVRQADLAGNTSAAQTGFAAFTIDSAAPLAPTLALAADTGSSTTDRLTSKPTIEVSGLDAGASWQFSIDAGRSWQAGSGSSFELADGSYGDGQVQVRQIDRAGNTSAAHTALAALAIDTVAAAPAMALLEDTGSSASDRLTSNGTIAVSGLEEGATWQYTLNGGSRWINGTGTSFVLPDGSYTAGQVQVRQSDAAGNTSPGNLSFAAVTVESVAASPGLTLVADTGSSSTDRITSNGTIAVSGLEEGATWQYSTNRGQTWLTGSGSSFVVPPGTYADGQVQARQRDAFGNWSEANTSFPAFSVILPSLSITPVNADQAEGDLGTTAFTFQIRRSGDTSIASSVAWSVTGSGSNPANALDFDGYALPSGSVTFAAGETSKIISVNVLTDTLFGPDETFAVTLSNPENAAIGSASATGVIRNDDLLTLEPVLASNTRLPNGALGSQFNKGWTATGLVYDPLQEVLWSSNNGQINKSDPNNNPSIIKMDTRGTAILSQIELKAIFPDSVSIQGLALDSTNQSLWYAALVENRIRNITQDGGVIGELVFTNPNGLAYDPLRDQLIVLHKTGPQDNPGKYDTISVVDKANGSIIRSYQTGVLPGSDWLTGADQLYFDPATRYVYLTYGADRAAGNVRVFDHDAGQHVGTIGSFPEVTATEGIAIVGSDIYMVSDDYFDNPNGLNRLLRYRHVLFAQNEDRDVVTGSSGSDDFRWGSLKETSLGSYDTIIGYEPDDRIVIGDRSYNAALSGSVGNAQSLNYRAIISLLTSQALPSNSAAAFTVTGMDGTFVALNDNRAAFQNDTDGLVFLKQFSIGLDRPVTIA
jgi:hypothetical protein